jgi:molybdopterin synthase sulfur carrier subunit
MRVRLLFFASLRETVGSAGEQVELPAEVREVGTLREWLAARGEPWSTALAARRTVRVAVNQAMATASQSLRDNDEVAFFPPVTGG